jgi:TolB-like protein
VTATTGPAAVSNTVDPHGIERQLERILSSSSFRKCVQLSRFLQFVVRESLAGGDGASKETLIGIEIFGRRPDYDPGTDPVVRVEARRLRRKLSLYYEREGHEDPIRIQVPKGGYLPAFDLVCPPAAIALRTIAVLPFADHSANHTLDALSDGLTARLIAKLAGCGGLRLASLTSVLRFKNRNEDPRRIGQELNATLILEGSLRRAGKRFRCDTQLIASQDGLLVWAGSFDSGHRDPFRVEDEFAESISQGVRDQVA